MISTIPEYVVLSFTWPFLSTTFSLLLSLYSFLSTPFSPVVSDVLTCLSSWGTPHPPIIRPEDVAMCHRHAKWRWFAKFSSSEELARLAMGPFVDELLNNAAHDASPKLMIYSAHDSTIATIICVLGLRLPPPKEVTSVELATTPAEAEAVAEPPASPSKDIAEEEAVYGTLWPEYGAVFEMQLVEDLATGKLSHQPLLPKLIPIALVRLQARNLCASCSTSNIFKVRLRDKCFSLFSSSWPRALARGVDSRFL
jgi:hypothetical protein